MAVAARKTIPISTNLVYLRELKRHYRYLYTEKVREMEDGSLAFHNARLFRREGINTLFLRGDSFEMNYQHGKLLAAEIRRGVLPECHRMIPNIIHNSVTKTPWLNRVLSRALDYLGNNVLLHNVTKDDLRDTFALSEGADLGLEVISGAMLSVEALTILAKYAVKTRGIHVHPMAFSGCSSFAAWGKHTTTGEMVVGRNLDYQLNGFFDANSLVTYHEPTDGTQSYVSLGSAGIHTPSLTSFNQSGIFLAVHMAPTTETSFAGTPVFFLASEVIKKARTFDEAVAIFKRHHPTAGWSFLLASFREKRVGSVEITYERMAVRESHSSFHAQTNHFVSPEMNGANLFINHSIDLDSHGRFCRMGAMAAETKLDAVKAAGILGDSTDHWDGDVRGLGRTLAVHITVGSSVLLPEQGKFYVANGMAPVSQNDYVEFPWLGKADPETFGREDYSVITGGQFCAAHPEKALATQKYIEAKVAYENLSETHVAYELMEQVVALDPDNRAYRFVHAMFAFKTGKTESGIADLGSLIDGEARDHTYHLALYYRGRAASSLGRRDEALVDFDRLQMQNGVDEKLVHAVRKSRNMTRLFGSQTFAADKLPLLMQFGDMLAY